MNHISFYAKTIIFLVVLLNNFCGMAQINALHNVQLTISSTDLSEDMSLNSTKNDELLLLIYSVENDTTPLKNLVYDTAFVFDKNQMQIELNWQAQGNNRYLYFLLEMDSDNPIVQLDPVLRMYYKEVIKCFNHRDYICIEKYLMDEDILDYNYFTIPSDHHRKGVYKLDRYQYDLHFVWKK